MNAYGDLDSVKTLLDITGTEWDTVLRQFLERSSRMIDKECKRKFYCEVATRYFDGAADMLFIDDLLSITTFKVDNNADGTFEDTYTEDTDFFLKPFNKFPKMWAEIFSEGSYGSFGGSLRRGIEIVGLWGYGNEQVTATPYSSSGVTATVADATSTSVTVSAADAIAMGQTILVDSEQMYVNAVSGTTLTVKRGVNGTTAAAHNAATAHIWEYPDDIMQACYIQAIHLFKGKDTGYTKILASTELGQLEVRSSGLHPEVKEIVFPYLRREYG